MVTPSAAHVHAVLDAERAQFVAANPTSKAAFAAGSHLFGQVPMTWMNKWSGGFPLSFVEAKGNRIVDADGHELIDFALGDTGAMAGHSPEATVAAIERRVDALGGITTMLPTPDAEWVAAELSRRFGMARWSFALSATDANRWALRLARLVTKRPKVLVFSYAYHGSVDETFIVVDADGQPRSRPGNVAPAVDPTETTRVVEFNDLEGLEGALAHGDVAAVLAEPALTNIGIVLPDPGYHDELRRLTRQAGALLMIDETHTFSAGPGGATAAWGLEPDVVTIGKSLGGGIPCGAYGIADALVGRIDAAVNEGADIVDVGGVGGTLAGNALSTAAMRATLADVLTEDAFSHMIELATVFTGGVESTLAETGLEWSVTQLGARAEYRFCSPAPRNGGESAAASDDLLDEFMHLYLLNRGVLMTPFHNMALMCPTTSRADVDRHTELFAAAVATLLAH
jgi:glutamate-1-semialdehyde 2,1-aminomutase